MGISAVDDIVVIAVLGCGIWVFETGVSRFGCSGVGITGLGVTDRGVPVWGF